MSAVVELFEREGELARLAGLLDEVKAGEGRLALIEGRAGVGKTALLGAVRRAAADEGFIVLSARGSELEREFAFGVVRQLFEPLLLDGAPDVFTGAAAPAERVFTAVDAAAGDSSFATLHALYWLGYNLTAGEPVLIAVDDVQWCDQLSLRYLVYLLHRMEGLRVLIAATLRTTDPGTDPGLLAEIGADPLTVAIRPQPLSVDTASAVISARLGGEPDRSFSHACHSATGGNPLLLRQLLSSLRAEGVAPEAAEAARVREVGSQAVSEVIGRRLAGLDPEVVEVARTVAVLGDRAPGALVAALAGVGEDALPEAARILGRLDVLDGAAFAFVHPLVRDAVYRQLGGLERERAHARAACLLHEAAATAQEVAAHLLLVPARAAVDVPVVKVLLAAVQEARDRGATGSAIAYLRRALEEDTGDRHSALLLELGLLEARISDPMAPDRLRAAYDTLEDPVARASAAAILAQQLLFFRPVEEAEAFLAEAAAAAPAGYRGHLHALQIMAIHFGARRWREIRAELCVTEVSGEGPGPRLVAAMSAFDTAMSGTGAAGATAALVLDALADGQLLNADAGFVVVPAIVLLTLADRPEVLAALERMVTAARLRGDLWLMAAAHGWSGYTQLWRGDLREAETLLRTAREEFGLWSHLPLTGAYATCSLTVTLLERGDARGARAVIDSLPRPPARNDVLLLWLRAHVELLLVEGRPADALELVDATPDGFEHLDHSGWYPRRPLRARALAALERDDEAEAVLVDELDHARRWGAPTMLGRALRLLGTARGDAGIPLLREAVEALSADHASRLERAKTLAALGQALRRTRASLEAREPLRQALDLAEHCGADGLVEHVRSEIYATGARPRRTALTGAGALTTSERRVADLAAAGRSNREIAQTLFVTAKTVEMHLSNAYRKLDIRSRADLAGALAAG